MAPLIFIIVLSVLDVMRINIIIIGFLFEISELLLYFFHCTEAMAWQYF